MNKKEMKENRKTYKMELVLRNGTQQVIYDVTVSYNERDNNDKEVQKNKKIE